VVSQRLPAPGRVIVIAATFFLFVVTGLTVRLFL
jgi:hypothetical protein